MSDLQGAPGELRATISITRKATGKVETYELVGHVTAEQELLRQRQALQLAQLQEAVFMEEMEVIDVAYFAAMTVTMH